jgi:hypothetical protein
MVLALRQSMLIPSTNFVGILEEEAAPVVTVSFVGHTVDAADASVYTFTNHAIGTATADRIVVVSIHKEGGTPNSTSVTIGGNVAPQYAMGQGGTVLASLHGLVVAAGTTATIAVTLGAVASRCCIGVWAVYGANSTVFDAQGNNQADGTSITLDSVDLAANGAAIIVATHPDPKSPWDINIGTEDFDEAIDAGGSHAAGVTYAPTPASTTQDFTATFPNTANGHDTIAAVSFQPA